MRKHHDPQSRQNVDRAKSLNEARRQRRFAGSREGLGRGGQSDCRTRTDEMAMDFGVQARVKASTGQAVLDVS